MDPMKEVMDRIVADKARRRKERAALPFPEKIRCLVRMQRRHAAILRTRGLDSPVWRIEDDEPDDDRPAVTETRDESR